MSMILIMLIALLCVVTILWTGYLLLRKIDDSEHDKYSKVVLQCINSECEDTGFKEFRYNVDKDRLEEILPCPVCKKTRQLIESE